MTEERSRRTARVLLGDALDRVRGDVIAVALLHVLPSLPFVVGAVAWFVEIDLRGRTPPDGGAHLPLLLVPKLLGWGALAAWAAARARGQRGGVRGSWLRALARAPEVLLAGSTAMLALFSAAFTGIGVIGVAAAYCALAAAVSDERVTGLRLLGEGLGAIGRDIGRSFWTVAYLCAAGAFVAVNLLALPVALIASGGGGLGLDLGIALDALSLGRTATWATAGLVSSLVIEALAVVAFAELQLDRRAEQEGSRFAAFADELEQRDAERAALRGTGQAASGGEAA